MATSRTTVRALRSLNARPTAQSLAFRARPAGRRGYANGTESTGSTVNPALLGGAAGGGLVFAIAYGYYYFSGAKTAVNSISSTKKYFDNSVKKLQDAAPEPNEALQWLRSTALAYSAAIPGAKGYVNTAFDDLDAIQSKHGSEVNKIITDMYRDVKSTTQKGGMSIETGYKVWEILGDKLKQISSLAGDAAEDILDNHPYIKQKVGGNLTQLRQLADQAGPEAKEEVAKTWEQVQSILNKGFSGSTITDIQKLISEKSEQFKKMGEQAWQKGLEQAKPYLDKNPKIKEVIENNADALKSGNIMELWEQVKKAASSGSTQDLEQYVDQAKGKAQQGSQMMGFNLDKYLSMVPGGAEIGQKWQQLQEVGEKHGDEAKGLMESTIKEIKDVLSKKMQEAQKLADSAKKNAS